VTPRTIHPRKTLLLKRDNLALKNSFILLMDYGRIVIGTKKTGEDTTHKILLTRREFNKMVDWYNGIQP
jgi:hypothetical protein